MTADRTCDEGASPATRGAEADGLRTLLRTAPMSVLGRLLDSSNTTLLVRLGGRGPDGGPVHAIYKPVAGERPLWDFPGGYLAYREVATWLVARAGGWAVVPPTVLRDGPFGPGSVQLWVTAVPAEVADGAESGSAPETGAEAPGSDGGAAAVAASEADAEATEASTAAGSRAEGTSAAAAADGIEVDSSVEHSERYVDLFPPRRVPAGWLPILRGQLADGSEVVLAHADRADVASVAVLDAVLNNSDRKGSHLLTGRDGRLWGIDHGVTLHAQDKLRTILWGWAGEPLPPADLARLETLHLALSPGGGLRAELAGLLTEAEIDALQERTRRLVRSGVHPDPVPGWPTVPWPPL